MISLYVLGQPSSFLSSWFQVEGHQLGPTPGKSIYAIYLLVWQEMGSLGKSGGKCGNERVQMYFTTTLLLKIVPL